MSRIADDLCAEVRYQCEQAEHFKRLWMQANDELERLRQQHEKIQAAEREAAQELLDAAIAVIERWDSPLWKDLPPTAKAIARLRDAVNKLEGDAEAEANSRRVVAALNSLPAAKWIDPNDKTQSRYLPHIGEPVLFCHQGKTYYGLHTGGSFKTGHGVTAKLFGTWDCFWMPLPEPVGAEKGGAE